MKQTVEKKIYNDFDAIIDAVSSASGAKKEWLGYKKPFLTIITRCYKRPAGISKNLSSIKSLIDKDIEQIFIHDNVGVGMFEANKSFSDPAVLDEIEGGYVFLLDDDDFIVNPNMVQLLKSVSFSEDSPEIIFFRMNIIGGPNGDLYPTPSTWGIAPKVAHIGGSCFVVRTDVYKKFIHNFAHTRMGDFAFIDAIWKTNPKVYWLDQVMSETGRIGRGRAE